MKQYIIGSAPVPARGQIPVVVSEPHVSRTHCRIFFERGQAYIEDLGSRNGTYVDGVRIQMPALIYEHSSVMLANTYPLNLSDYVTVKGSFSAQAAAPASGNLEYAPFIVRFVAYLVDGVIIGVPLTVFILFLNFFFLWGIPLVVFLLLELGALLAIGHFYFALPISQNGTTFGRKMFGIEYLDLSTMTYPKIEKVWLRLIGYILSSAFFGLGFLMPLFNEKQQALHDFLANTIVVKK